ncbi:MAG: nucleoside triphosphate pyrophosphohydrolase [Ruminococcus sp.]|nr:nucleoside triphosphate pyrophosphohydrolase [Ruminococcus sp.]
MENEYAELLAKDRYDIDDLAHIVRILRSENGCPWDKVQTHKTIKKDFLEEVYEVMEAIDAESPEMMREELGDVLLQVVFHCVLESEEEHFGLDEVTTDICRKLIVRHPHVFGDVKADTVDKVLTNWDSIKKETKGQETYTQTLESVPKNFPALMRAQKLVKRADRAGVSLGGVSELSDSIAEKAKAIGEENDKTKAVALLGKMMFECAALARELDADAEETLTDENNAFIGRFREAEEKARQNESEIRL